jgi:5-formyltetrahydrofolate cyclo-ligase
MGMVKKVIRREYSAKRNSLTAEEMKARDEKMYELFGTIALQGISHLLSYCPIPLRKEFNAAVCENLLRLENPLLHIYLPRLNEDGVTMEAIEVNKETVFINNKYDIPEPTGPHCAEPQIIDAVFVPLIAFDTKGFRVGYGKGFYDRFLARCAQDVVKIGFSYFEAIDAIGDINEFDVPLNYCITPMRVYEF